MADPFEVRMRFTSQLQHLNASVTSSQKAAHFALKNRDMDEDLHSCILEQLEKNSMNNRANIMYFIEHFVDLAQREQALDFVRMMQRDILRVVDAVAPEDGSGAANIKVVRRVLAGMQAKGILAPDTVAEIEACLATRDTAASAGSVVVGATEEDAPEGMEGVEMGGATQATALTDDGVVLPANTSLLSTSTSSTSTSTRPSHPLTTSHAHTLARPATKPAHHPNGTAPTTTGGPISSASSTTPLNPALLRLDKRQIEQRIEEDRERHKRLRESIWAVDSGGSGPGAGAGAGVADGEFERLWDEVSEVGEDDYLMAEEEAGERRAAAGRVVSVGGGG